jgi:hypothetical protein
MGQGEKLDQASGTSRFLNGRDSEELSAQLKGKPLEEENETRLNTRQLMIGEKRTLVIVKALTAFYVSLGLVCHR